MSKRNTSAKEDLAAFLRAKIDKLTSELESTRKLWEKDREKIGPAMAAQFESAKLAKQIRVIEHIAAGRKDEAILEILSPLQMILNFEVVYADDKTRNAAQDEMLEAIKKKMVEHLDTMILNRSPKEQGKP